VEVRVEVDIRKDTKILDTQREAIIQARVGHASLTLLAQQQVCARLRQENSQLALASPAPDDRILRGLPRKNAVTGSSATSPRISTG